MGIKLFAFTCGWLGGELGYLMEGGEGKIDLPIPAYLIEHPKGTMLFDTGMHPDCQHDPAGRIGPRVTQLFSFNYHPGEEISARLEAIGATRQGSTSSSIRTFISTMSAATR
jgi:N-acyl homoserine lactone hydrolase